LRVVPEVGVKEVVGVPAAGCVTARSAGLADLHATGGRTDAEYASAKARVLAGE